MPGIDSETDDVKMDLSPDGTATRQGLYEDRPTTRSDAHDREVGR